MARPVDNYSWDLPAYFWWPPHDPACRWLFPRSSSLPLVASTWPSLRMTSASALFRQMISSSCCWTFFSRQSTRWHSSPWSWLNSPSVTPSRDQRNYKGIKQVSEKFQCGKFCNRTTFIYTAKTTYQKSLKYLLYILKYLCGNHVTLLMAIIHAYFCCTCKNGNSNNTEKLICVKKGLFGQ